MKKLFTIMLIFLSIGMASAYEPSSFRAGSAAVYGVQTTYPGTGNLDGTAPISKSMLSAVTTSLLLTNRL